MVADDMPMRMDGFLTLCSILVPKNKISCFPGPFGRFLEQLASNFSGWTLQGETLGAWRSDEDSCLTVKVAIPPTEPAWSVMKALVSGLAGEINEKCLFVEWGGTQATMVWAAPPPPAPVEAPVWTLVGAVRDS